MAERLYYLETAGDSYTQIGRQWVEPLKPPTAVTEENYEANLAHIEHYVAHGTIIVHKPGTPGSARAAVLIRQDRMEQEKKETRDKLPQARQLPIGLSADQMPQYMEDMRMSMGLPEETPDVPKFSRPVDSATLASASLCVAVTMRSGKQCKNEALSGKLVCSIHMGVLKRGGKVVDADGNSISADGRSYAEV